MIDIIKMGVSKLFDNIYGIFGSTTLITSPVALMVLFILLKKFGWIRSSMNLVRLIVSIGIFSFIYIIVFFAFLYIIDQKLIDQ